MSRKNLRNSSGIVYSTSNDFKPEIEEEETESLDPAQQLLKVRLDKKQRGGKTVTLIEGLQMSEQEIEDLARQLKTYCGGGGSAKNGEIIIQGDHRDKIVLWFNKRGFTKTRKI